MRLPLILYIEDSPFYQKMLLDIIGVDYEMHFADTGFLGIVKALSVLPDIIFLDVQLPDARGPELIKTIKTYLPKSIIIMVTSDNSAQTVSESKELGANGYIIKPFSVAQINKHLDKWLGEFKKSPKMVSTPEIAKKIAALIQEQKALENVEKINKYQLWMEKKLPITIPFVFLEVVDLPVIYNDAKQICTTILAFALEFNGELSCIGFWNELKTKSPISAYLIKSVIKSLKNRELNDIYTLTLDPQITDFIPEFQSSYPNAIVGQRLIPYHKIFCTQDLEIKKIGRKLILIPAFMEFEKSLEMLNSLSFIDKDAIEVRNKIALDLMKIKHLFSFPPEIRSILFDTRWLIIIINHFLSIVKHQEAFDSVNTMQSVIESKLAEKNVKFFYDLHVKKGDCVYTNKEYKEAMFIFSQTIPERFPQNERLV